MHNWYGVHPDDNYYFVESRAIEAGERARMLMALEDENESAHRSIRHRLAATLVHLGVKLDPMAAEYAKDGEED